MERTRKTWGEKNNIFVNDLCEVSVLHLEPMQRCSWHRHDAKYNLFYVLSGRLVLKLEDGDTEVLPGQIFTTFPGEYHEFQTRDEPTICIEIMYVRYDSHDIQRVTLGGKIEEPPDAKYHLNCEICNEPFLSKSHDTSFCHFCNTSISNTKEGE